MMLRVRLPDKIFEAILLLVFIVFIVFGAIGASAQETDSLPPGAARDLVVDKCTDCHALSTALVKRASRDTWQETVERMVTAYGAPIDAGETQLAVEYLSANFGVDSSYSPGQQMLAEQCFRCHGEGMWKDLKTDRAGWLSALYRMVGRGGRWTEDQIDVMADYLAATYPAGTSQ
jgi:hypothetical protein